MRIGNIDIDSPVCLAPMEDVSNLPFRLLCKENGADIVYTEFSNCEAIIRGVQKTLRKTRVDEGERPVAVQIYGSAEDSMQQAAEMCSAQGPDFLDINCGCWVKKVANRGDGAGLLRDLGKFRAVVRAVQRGTDLPVTVKTRLGWDHENIVIEDVARMMLDLGVPVLTVHFRTRKQGYKGTADWSWIPRIKEAAPELQLMANGDINTPEDAARCFELGADGVMIARAAIHAPWIFEHMKHYVRTGEKLPELSLQERFEMAIRHLRASVEYRGHPAGVFCFRRHYAGYLNGVPNIAHLRRELMQIEDMDLVIERLREFLEKRRLAATG